VCACLALWPEIVWLCGGAAVGLCVCAIVRLCDRATIWLCSRAAILVVVSSGHLEIVVLLSGSVVVGNVVRRDVVLPRACEVIMLIVAVMALCSCRLYGLDSHDRVGRQTAFSILDNGNIYEYSTLHLLLTSQQLGSSVCFRTGCKDESRKRRMMSGMRIVIENCD